MQRRDLDRLIAVTLRRARDDLGWTQADLASELRAAGWGGWVPSTIAGIESGTRRVSLTEAGELADVLGVGIGYLLDAGDGEDRENARRLAGALANTNSRPAPPYVETNAEAARRARDDIERGELERLFADRLDCTLDDLAVTVRKRFGEGSDVLSLREDFALFIVGEFADKGRPIELSTARRHATRGIQRELAKWSETDRSIAWSDVDPSISWADLRGAPEAERTMRNGRRTRHDEQAS